jgi:ribonuclease HI
MMRNRVEKSMEQPIAERTFVFTDGGAKNNGKRNCRAAWGVFFSIEDERNEAGQIFLDPSNQRAELFAISMALKKLQKDNIAHTTLVTDSQYAINCLSKWSKNWDRTGWKTSKGTPVSHASLLKECLSIINELDDFKFQHVNSHQLQPIDHSSMEWKLWFGNFKVDQMVSKILNRNSTQDVPLPVGKPVRITWDGTMDECQDDVSRKKGKGKGKGREKDETVSGVEVSW